MYQLQTQKAVDITASGLIEKYFNTLQVKPKTERAYKQGINYFMQYMLNNNITSPSSETVISFLNSLSEQGRKATTIKTYLEGIKSLFKWLEYNQLYKNITIYVKSPKVSKDFKKDCLTPSQVKSIIASIDNTRDKIIFMLGVSVGLRTMEIANLNKSDIETKAGVPILWVLGKARVEKEYLKIPEQVYNMILEYLSTRSDNKEPLILATSNRSNGRIRPESISRIIKTILRNNNIDSERITAHSLRHTFATFSLLSGNSLDETQKLCRHNSTTTTQIYNHSIDKLKSKSINNIFDFINKEQ